MHIGLLATDGKIQKRILWVAVTSNSVCSGYCQEGRDKHITYHFDGNVYHNWFGEKPEKSHVLPPLKVLRGWRQLYCTGFTSDILKLRDTPAYSLKKLDATVSVDTRAYKRGIGCMVFIVAPREFDAIAQTIRGIPETPTTEAHVFLRCNPWISIVLYGNVYR